MAKKNTVTAETLQDAKERVKKAFRPSDDDPIVRFIGENGKMGLRHIFSEEVVEASDKDFIEMPEAEVIEEEVWEGRVIKDLHYKRESDLLDQLSGKYRSEYERSEVQYYPPFDNYYKFYHKNMIFAFNGTVYDLCFPHNISAGYRVIYLSVQGRSRKRSVVCF